MASGKCTCTEFVTTHHGNKDNGIYQSFSLSSTVSMAGYTSHEGKPLLLDSIKLLGICEVGKVTDDGGNDYTDRINPFGDAAITSISLSNLNLNVDKPFTLKFSSARLCGSSKSNWVPILCLSLGIVVVVFAIAFLLVRRFSKSTNNETPKIGMSISVSKSKMYDALADESVSENDIKRV